ncbi:hypothetical protein Cgig2_032980 [Carnegiea gigantea]|uniref:Uncharacterized protein n=1 Tax=Carnegiea gigantea TaxID=171969 RepID=A0A9Q1GJ74_9CARY|nr:hypothetical protein Cgig2_032980 [Carnegiea gigantea]
MINGVKCTKIDTDDVTPKIEYWQPVILCSVLGANPPLEVIERMYGHKEEECRKKTFVGKEWRKVLVQTEQERNIPKPSNNFQSQEAVVVNRSHTQRMDAEGFIPVVRPLARQHDSPRNVTEVMRDQNHFESLQELQGVPAFELQKEGLPPNGQNMHCPRPPPSFHFYDMWARDIDYLPLVKSQLPASSHKGPYQSLKMFLWNTKKALQQLNKNHYADLKTQQSIARAELERTHLLLQANPMNPQLLQKEKELRDHYSRVLSSMTDIIRQQCKAEWITYGDECTRYFFAKAKQRKTALYIFEI